MNITDLTQDNDYTTQLHTAAFDDDTESCKKLLDDGADINANDVEGRTPCIGLWEGDV